MKTKEEFINLVDSRFYRHLCKKSLIPFDVNIQKREDYLGGVYDSLLSSVTEYTPSQPREYISIPKSPYVIRMVPTFELSDYCIYYFCIKVLEEYLAKERVKGTFGCYALGNKLRRKESQDFEPSFEDSVNENSFNAFAWKKEYNEYIAMLTERAEEMGKKYHFAVKFDLANFYDCIRLDRLGEKIRDRVNNNQHNDEIYLLLRFLKYWDNKYDSNKNIGIPQEELGDCSRILANFYLQDYDQYISAECKKRSAYFLRYADDQIIFTKSEQDAKDLMYNASLRLFEDGLNMNVEKVKEFLSYQDFDDIYGFSIFKKLRFESQDINAAVELFLQYQNNKDFRASSVLKRVLHKKIKIGQLNIQNRIKLLSYLLNEKFLLFANDHYMQQIYRMLKDDNEKEEYLSLLQEIGDRTKFKSYLIYLNRFRKYIGDDNLS